MKALRECRLMRPLTVYDLVRCDLSIEIVQERLATVWAHKE